MPLTLLEVLRRSTRHLAASGSETPRLDSELILAHALRVDRISLYVQFERPLGEEELALIRPLLAARAQGRPLAYLLGRREFFGLDFVVDERVLIPRPESELLVELAIRLRPDAERAADLGSGSGCLGIALAANLPRLRCDLVELDPGAAAVARQNIARHNLGERVSIREGSWAEPLDGLGPYQLLVSNPPYVSTSEWGRLDRTVRDFEPRRALDGGEDGLRSYRELLPQLSGVAAPGATILLEGDPRRLGPLERLAQELLRGVTTARHLDLAGRERVLEVRLP
ncbi:MAG: peptide chain release factor N(5)-glutamine methyltransferase [Candidatus Dormibacteria bacterium]